MSVLDDIVAGVRTDLARRQAATSEDDLRAALADVDPPRDAMPVLRSPGSSVIAEVKRRSPEQGRPRGDRRSRRPRPSLRHRRCRGDQRAHRGTPVRGSLDDLRAVRAAVDVPLLRKDFVVDPYQVLESRAAGADLVLLIVAALDDDLLRRLHDQARELGMVVLVEVHDEPETARAVDLGAELVGVNARNLKTLDVDPDTFGRLAPLLSSATRDRVLVAESGISSPVDVKRYVAEGAHAVLVGEALVKDGDPEAAVRAMTGITP